MKLDTNTGQYLNNTSNVEIKQLSAEGQFEGYASIFNETDEGMDEVAPGAYRKSLSSGIKPKMLWQHDSHSPIGVWEEIKEDDRGLFVRGQLLLDTQRGREAASMLKAGAIDGMSIGYRTIKSSRDETTGVRRLMEVELWEISIVTFPMLQTATVDAVKTDWTKTDISRTLRNAGAPSGFIKKLIAGGFDFASGELTETQRKVGQMGDVVDLNDLLRSATSMMKG